jgi:hypothetical protein
MLLMAAAIYLTVISVILYIPRSYDIVCGTPYLYGFSQMFSLLQILVPIVTVFLYVTVYSLLYVAYRGQFRKITGQQVISIVGLQSFITALLCVGVYFVSVFVILWYYRYDSLLELFASPALFCMLGAFLLAGICFIIHRRLSVRG